jgi:6-pyruvoyltetrahydropterin/6-carboxytetrahydropterin synthase
MSTPAGHSCSKRFSDYPCCHRQWRHRGHCRFVHGYSRSFTCWFRAHHLDAHGFVVDFSSLRDLEQRLAEQFDHTFLVNADDPLLEQWRSLHEQGALDLRVMTNVGMEASAELVWGWANELLRARDHGRSCCWRVEARENEKNAATFTRTPGWFGSGAPSSRLPDEPPAMEDLNDADLNDVAEIPEIWPAP